MWTKIMNQPVGGVREISFIQNTNNLMVLGSGRRTIFSNYGGISMWYV